MPKPRPEVEGYPSIGTRALPPTDSRLSVGVDVVDVPRFSHLVALRGSAMCERVFTSHELETCHGDVPRLAARFAAKEAAAKALGVGIGPIGWRDVEIRTGPGGEPELALAGAARASASDQGLDRWAVSLSHDATHAIAFVVATGRRGTEPLP
jgi:holo-[acyl-carrier protein] synthase